MAMKSLNPFSRESTHLPASMRSGFGTLQREIDRVFDEFTSNFGLAGSTELMPKMDARESDTEVELTIELPGLEEKDVNVSIADSVLTIRGERNAENETKDGDYHYRERSYGSFVRSVTIPTGVDESKIKATLKNGLLTVNIPKTPAAQAKKIEVTSAG